MFTFITGNQNKKVELERFLQIPVQSLDLDIPEIQSLDIKEVTLAKLAQARRLTNGPILVEDNGLIMDCLGKLPGPLIKWFEDALGNENLYELTVRHGNNKAINQICYGYDTGDGTEPLLFVGEISGTINKPHGDKDWGWGPIFVPNGQALSYGQMEREQKDEYSPRRLALEPLKKYLMQHDEKNN